MCLRRSQHRLRFRWRVRRSYRCGAPFPCPSHSQSGCQLHQRPVGVDCRHGCSRCAGASLGAQAQEFDGSGARQRTGRQIYRRSGGTYSPALGPVSPRSPHSMAHPPDSYRCDARLCCCNQPRRFSAALVLPGGSLFRCAGRHTDKGGSVLPQAHHHAGVAERRAQF